MQCKQMAESLQQLAPLLERDSGAVVLHLAEVVRPEGAKAFGAVATKLENRLKTLELVPVRSPASLLLDRMAAIGSAAGAATLQKDFSAASQLLALLGSLDQAQVPAILAAAVAPPPKKSKVDKAPQIDAREAADMLTAMSTDKARFDELLERYSKCPKDALSEIAQRFLGYPRQFKSKAEILKAIRSRQLQDALDASREYRGSKLAV